jgi:hypothetical protein
VSAASNLIRLPYEGCKGVIELLVTGDPKLMDKEALRVGGDPKKPLVSYFSLQIEEAVEGRFAGLRAGKTPVGSLEGNGRLCDTQRVRATCGQQSDEAFIEVDDGFGLVGQMPLDVPFLSRVHVRRVTMVPRCPACGGMQWHPVLVNGGTGSVRLTDY